MGVTKTVRSKHVSKGPNKPSVSSKSRFDSSKSRVSKKSKVPPPTHQKTKPVQSFAKKPKKQKNYTDEELGIPKLNMITPAGVRAPRGKKKGKVFVDDGESMMTILAMVNADKEGQIESKLMKARQMEEIREARMKEAGKREDIKKGRLEEAKDALRKKKRKKNVVPKFAEANAKENRSLRDRKRVSFV